MVTYDLLMLSFKHSLTEVTEEKNTQEEMVEDRISLLASFSRKL